MIHNIRYRVFIYENEDKDEILEALLNILPTAEPEVEEAEGLLEEKMLILTGTISKKRETKEFLNNLISSVGEDQLVKLYNDLDKKMDEIVVGDIIRIRFKGEITKNDGEFMYDYDVLKKIKQ